MKPTLIIGYGNVDRQDDGAAWHVLARLAQKLGNTESSEPNEEFYPEGDYPHLLSTLQLTPEMAETVAEYERVCFVDAHTGAIPEEIGWQPVTGKFQNSPFTHHFTPQSCLSLVDEIYHSKPEAILVSIRGYNFGFNRQLSECTSNLVKEVVAKIMDWLHT